MNNLHFQLLLADDDPDDCLFFEQALKEIPVNTSLKMVKNGEVLMQYLLNETNTLPDILFLDLNMPRKNGFECLAEIKTNENLKNLPVVVCSTSLNHQVVNTVQSDGADYYIRKPSSYTQLKNVIEEVIGFIAAKKNNEAVPSKFIVNA